MSKTVKNKISCPSWLDAEAAKEWRRISKELKDDILNIDLKALESYCASYSKWRRCESILAAEGLTFDTDNGYKMQRPEVSISNKAIQEMRAWAKELGFTPASRARISKNAATGENYDDEMEDLISK